jgi:two-component sensor histidine kinase
MLWPHQKHGNCDHRMTGTPDNDDASMQQLLDTPDLAEALGSDRFKQFLDNVPIAIAVSELKPSEHIIYVNVEFERLSGTAATDIQGKPWSFLPGQAAASDDDRALSDAIADEQDYIGTFLIEHDVAAKTVDAWSNIIDGEDGHPVFRLIALADASRRGDINLEEFEQQIREKDILLNELQHRVKNNLQMITALIRMESRRIPGDAHANRFDRLAGRVEALSLLYRSLSDEGSGDTIDLGIYLSQIASAVMRAHAVEGIHLDMQVDTWPVSINVAMPTGLVVNELLTNALKHAFEGREGGTITLHSLVDETGCRVLVGDDGIGLAKDATWPKVGKLGAMIVQSLRQNAKADIEVHSEPGKGVQVTIIFDRADA